MFRSSLGPRPRDAVPFEQSDFHGIWMKNCKFPIDILWLDEARTVVHVENKRCPRARPIPVRSTSPCARPPTSWS